MLHQSIDPDRFTFLTLLKTSRHKTVRRHIHQDMIDRGMISDIVLGSSLVYLYARYDDLDLSIEVFNNLPYQNIVSWSAMFSGYVQHGEGELALRCFENMQLAGFKPDKIVFMSCLKLCGLINSIREGRYFHAMIIESGFQNDIVVGSTLIDMYVKCGNMDAAERIFDVLPDRNVVSWGAMITGYIQHGLEEVALEFFDKMRHDDIKPDNVIFLSTLKACANIGTVEQARQIHEVLIEDGQQFDIGLGSSLVHAYAKCGNMKEAHRNFQHLVHQRGISICASRECIESEAEKVRKIFLYTLKACGSIDAVEEARIIHGQIISSRIQPDVALENALIDVYAKCGSLEEACRVFDRLPYRSVILWSSLIGGFAQSGEGHFALESFEKMQNECIKPGKVIFLNTLKACAIVDSIGQGRQIHEQIIGSDLQYDVAIGSSLVDMYGKCGSMEEARKVFESLSNRNVISWASLISGYVLHGKEHLALECFENMQREGINPNKAVFLCSLKACSVIMQGRCIHAQVIGAGMQSDIAIRNTILAMYAKCGSLQEADIAFSRLEDPDLVSWGVIIDGYVQQQEAPFALQLFRRMQQNAIQPDKFLFSSVVKACGSLGAIGWGRQMHANIMENGLEFDVAIGNALVDMYVKCGSLEEAYNSFQKLLNPNTTSWNAMIAGYSQLGKAKLAIQCFEKMQACGVKLDDIAFGGVLAALSRAGFVHEAFWYFTAMRDYHGIKVDHYHLSSMVDLLGHGGHLEEAENLLKFSPQMDFGLWMSLLSACTLHCNVNMGKRCLDAIATVYPFNSAPYVHVSSIYARLEYSSNCARNELPRIS